MDEFEQARAARENLEKVWRKYRDDYRFQYLRNAMVSMALESVRDIEPDPDRLDRDRYEVATRAASLVLAQIYEGDAEIVMLRAQVAQYKKIAEDLISLSPMPFVVTKRG